MNHIKQYAPALAYLLLAFITAYAVWTIQQNTLGTIYQNQIDSCERGNLIRQVVYQNTRQAAAIEPNASYRDQLTLLRTVPTVNLEDGTVDCQVVVEEP